MTIEVWPLDQLVQFTAATRRMGISPFLRGIQAIVFYSLILIIVQLPSCVLASEELEMSVDGDRAVILERIRLEVKNHAASIESIDVKWTRQNIQPASDTIRIMPFERMHWTRSGNRQSLRTEGFVSLNGERKSQAWYGFDGSQTHALWYHPSDPSKLNTATVVDGERHFRAIDIPLLLGWKVVGRPDESLATVIARPEAKLLGKRRVHGASCYEVEVSPFMLRSRPNDAQLLTAWFDPKCGWLPRRIEIRSSVEDARDRGSAKSHGPGTIQWECSVKSFDAVADPAHNAKLFFPTSGEILVVGTVHPINVDFVELNPLVAESSFRPEIPDGTLLEDHPGTRRYQRTLLGGEQASAERDKRLQADLITNGIMPQSETSTSSPPAIDARPNSSSGWPTIFLIASALSFTGALAAIAVKRFHYHS